MVSNTKQTTIIEVRAKGDAQVKALANSVSKVSRNVKEMNSGFGKLKGVFAAAFAGVGIRQITKAADSFQLLQDRIKVFAQEGENVKDIFSDIVRAAKLTKTSVDTLAEGYTRVAVATSDLGLSSNAMLGVVTALQQTLRLSGATAQEASSTFLQFSQALSLGRVQGQELRAILLNDAVLANLLAEELDVTKGQLRSMGEQGLITSNVALKALSKKFRQLNIDASQLATTFEQANIIAFDAFKVRVDEVNKKMNLSILYAKLMMFTIDNLTVTIVGLAAVIATTLVPALIKLNVVTKANLIALAISIIAVAVTYLATNWEVSISRMEKYWLKFVNFTIEGMNTLRGWIATTIGKFLPKVADGMKKQMESGGKFIDKNTKRIKELDAEITKLTKRSGESDADFLKRLGLGANSISVSGSEAAKSLKELNKAIKDGSIKSAEYTAGIIKIKEQKLNESFTEGKITIDAYNMSLTELKATTESIDSSSMITGIELGTRQAMENIGTFAEEVAGVTKNAFGTLEDSLVDFTKTGTFEFEKFTLSIIEDINRMIIRMAILNALKSGLSSAFGGDTGTTDKTLSSGNTVNALSAKANGDAFSNGNVIPFANGGVVGSPTMFPMNGMKTGLMGEAGPEAIMPLSRGKSGKLGVSAAPVIVNVVNNVAGTETTTEEKENSDGSRQIDIMIVKKVSEAFGEGQFDRPMKNLYGLNRKGQ